MVKKSKVENPSIFFSKLKNQILVIVLGAFSDGHFFGGGGGGILIPSVLSAFCRVLYIDRERERERDWQRSRKGIQSGADQA